MTSKNKRHLKILNQLCKVAEDVSPVGAARVASAIVIKNQIISLGVCQYKTDPFQKRFGKNEESQYLHAETCAIKNALRRISVDELEKATIYIARMKLNRTSNHGEYRWGWGLAKPCKGCRSCINTFNIKNVVWTTNKTGEFECV